MTNKTFTRLWWISIILSFLVGWGLTARVHAQTREVFIGTFSITKQNVIDMRGIEFYELRSSKGAFLLSGDADLELMQTLRRQRKVILVVEEAPEK